MGGNGSGVAPGADPVAGIGPPPVFDSRAAADAAYNRIMAGAARIQEALNAHVIASAFATDPVGRAEALDRAVRAAEMEIVEFRRARDVVAASAPGIALPPMPPSVLAGRMPRATSPRRF